MNVFLTTAAIIAFVVIGLLLSLMILYARSWLVDSSRKKIIINGNQDEPFEVDGGQTLLGALSENGISVPSPCGGKATCKQCKVQVKKGGGEPLETDVATFTPKQLKEGWRLSCQCKVKDDIEMLLPESLLELKEFEGRVVANENVATFIKELVVEVAEEDMFEYLPGDYLQFHVPAFKTNTSDWKETIAEEYRQDWEKFGLFDTEINYSHLVDYEVVRAYSMASYPLEDNILKFNIRISTPPIENNKVKNLPWGVCSSYTFSLKEGGRVRLSGPFGESHMIGEKEDLVFLIGGAGSSFGRSHIMDLFYNQKTARKVSFWYGARSLKENIYQEDFERLANEHENFTYYLVLSEPTEEDREAGWDLKDPLKTGFLFKAFEKGQLQYMDQPENVCYFVCGPPKHNESTMQLLDDYGVPRENIVLDDFGS